MKENQWNVEKGYLLVYMVLLFIGNLEATFLWYLLGKPCGHVCPEPCTHILISITIRARLGVQREFQKRSESILLIHVLSLTAYSPSIMRKETLQFCLCRAPAQSMNICIKVQKHNIINSLLSQLGKRRLFGSPKFSN